MKNTMFYILSVGVAFYIGFKMPKEPVVKQISTADELLMQLNDQKKVTEQCIISYEGALSHAKNKIKNLEAQIDTCEEKYDK